MVPAHERLDGAHGALGELDDGLVVKGELLSLERLLEGGRQLQPQQHGRMHLRLEELMAVLAAVLGDIHGGVGVAQ
ncbi:MAG: hypothetical protein ABR529_10640 [Actinomycetota bacterium]